MNQLDGGLPYKAFLGQKLCQTQAEQSVLLEISRSENEIKEMGDKYSENARFHKPWMPPLIGIKTICSNPQTTCNNH